MLWPFLGAIVYFQVLADGYQLLSLQMAQNWFVLGTLPGIVLALWANFSPHAFEFLMRQLWQWMRSLGL
jgi:hypothetical protein